MKKAFIVSFLCLSFAPAVAASIPWWERPTVCKLDPTKCYTSMGIGYDTEQWDADSGCWGMKIICPDALTAGGADPVAMGLRDIERGTGIKSDFDTNVLNGDCFGMRKTMDNGAMVMYGDEYVRVWCDAGILDGDVEYTEFGAYTSPENQPTCSELADMGLVATLNGKCYGKYYDTAKYHIQCDGNDILPSRLVLLNGADYTTSSNAPADKNAANKLFDAMESKSAEQRNIYFD